MAVAANRTSASSAIEEFEGLFVDNVDAVFNVAYRVLWNRSDVEDVVQRTFVKAVTRLRQLRDGERVRPWLLQVAYRESIAVIRLRREIPTDPSEMPEDESWAEGPENAAVAAEATRILNDAMAKMESDERLAVVLRDVEQLSMREVAGVLGVGLSAAKMRVHRGRASLRILIATKEVR